MVWYKIGPHDYDSGDKKTKRQKGKKTNTNRQKDKVKEVYKKKIAGAITRGP